MPELAPVSYSRVSLEGDDSLSTTSSADSLPLLDIPQLPSSSNGRFLLPSHTGDTLSPPSPSALRRFLRRVFWRCLEVAVLCAVLAPLTLLLRSNVAPPLSEYTHRNFTAPPIHPTSYLSPSSNTTLGPANVFLDGHSHSLVSDGDMTPAQLVEWSLSQGYNALVVSDHNDADGAKQAQEYVEANRKGEIVIVPGQEYSCCRIHMNILLLNRTIAPTSPWPSNEELARVVREVHAEGGLVVVNHPAWSNRTTYPYQQATLPDHPSLQELLDMGVDGVEVVNGQVYDARTHLFQQANPSALFALTGSDVHDPDGAYAWTALHAPALTLPAIMAELRAHRTAIYMDAAGTRARVYPEVSTFSAWFLPIRTAASLFSMLVEHERGMYSFQGSFCHPEILRPRWTVILASVVYIALGISLWLFVRPRVIRMAHRTYRWVRYRRRF